MSAHKIPRKEPLGQIDEVSENQSVAHPEDDNLRKSGVSTKSVVPKTMEQLQHELTQVKIEMAGLLDKLKLNKINVTGEKADALPGDFAAELAALKQQQ